MMPVQVDNTQTAGNKAYPAPTSTVAKITCHGAVSVTVVTARAIYKPKEMAGQKTVGRADRG